MRSLIVFLDHTTAAGGAELALARTLARPPADADMATLLIIPNGPKGAFRAVPPSMINMVGPVQRPGAATLTGWKAISSYIYTVLVQGLRLRTNGHFRVANVVVANTARSAVYGWIAVLGRQTSFVVHIRDEVSRAALGRVGVVAYRFALRRADTIIANSGFTLSSVKPHLSPRTATHVINSPIGVNVREPQNETVRLAHKFGMVARIDPWKGHALLIDAFYQAFSESHEQLYFAGSSVLTSGKYITALQQRVSDLGMTGRVHFEGQLEDVATFIDNMDVCVQCSLRPEPMGQNVLQYIARRCPVVAADAGGPRDFVRGGINGVLFKMGDVDSLASALAAIAENHELRSQIAGNDERMTTDEEVVDRIYAVLTGRLQKTPRGRFRSRSTTCASRSIRRRNTEAG